MLDPSFVDEVSEVKKLLTSTAQPIPGVSADCQGAGLIDLKVARDSETPSAAASAQGHAPSTGSGSLDAARGSARIERDGVVLEGEQDIFGNAFDSAAHAELAAGVTTWSGGDWNGTTWSGTTWSGTTWSGDDLVWDDLVWYDLVWDDLVR